MALQLPKCPLCRTPLRPSGKYWVCPQDNFVYNVTNGVPGRPMWGPREDLPQSPQPPQSEETFEGWLAERGVTPEMFKDQDDKTKEDLKTAFYQRGRKDADVELLPPR